MYILYVSNRTEDYYDANTRQFLTFGHGNRVKAVRRAVWAPGVESRDDAIQYVNSRISLTAAQMKPKQIVDLGCGVGESLLYLESRFPDARLKGVTLSRVQAEIAALLTQKKGSRAGIVKGSYLDENFYRNELGPGPVLYFMIESLLHCPDYKGLLDLLMKYSGSGDRVIICDDFLLKKPDNPGELKMLSEFRDNWHAACLITPEELKKAFRKRGFINETAENWTGYLELFRIRDWITRIFLPVIKSLPGTAPWRENLIGGTALQSLLNRGYLGYYFTVFLRS
jgi:hypothetical protein